MKTIKIKSSSSSYDIKLGHNIINKIPEFLLKINFSGKIAVIIDSNVSKLYLEKLKGIFDNACYIVIPAGEEYKTLETVSEIYEKLNENGITRKDMILAFGGGVTGDISGFCAATYLRGIKYIQVPTTLLSMVDSSIGGKTGVDLKSGKNLVGAFYKPQLVVADLDLLKTLPDNQIASGMAEIIKSGFIKDKKLIDKLEKSTDFDSDLEEFILRAINVKKEIVKKDEFEKYERMLLNFGHTFGHAIEKYYGFKGITHGEAVAIGMCLITKDIKVKELLEKILEKYNLKTSIDIDNKTLIDLCKNDKKASGDGINIAVVDKVGSGKIVKLSFEELGEIYG